MADRKTILAVNHDMSSVQAMIPALQVLKEEFNVVPITWPDSPAYATFKQAGFEPQSFFESRYHPERLVKRLLFDLRLNPILVLLGVSTTNDGPETSFLKFKDCNPLMDYIPFVCIYETWPHGWLGREDKRELYRCAADRVLVFDHFSREEFVRNGFDAQKVMVTGNPANDDLATMAAKSVEIREKTRKKLGAGPYDTVLLYCTTNQDAPENSGRDASNPRFLGFTEREVMELIFGFSAVVQLHLDRDWVSHPTRLWVRIHPAQPRAEVEELIKKSGVEATIIGQEWPDGRPLLVAADAVFGTVTMMLQLAAFLGRPAFSCLPHLTKVDPLFCNKLGIVTPLYHEVAIAGVVLASPYLSSFEQEKKTPQKTYSLIPNATENVCRVLRQMIT